MTIMHTMLSLSYIEKVERITRYKKNNELLHQALNNGISWRTSDKLTKELCENTCEKAKVAGNALP